jgi:geranylgeranyl transferase type-2 subunit beta
MILSLSLFLLSSNEIGGFGGSVGHDPHLLYTLSAIQVFALFNAMDRLDRDRIAKCLPFQCLCLFLILTS